MSPLNSTQEAARAQFESRSQNYGKTHILADVSDVAPENREAVRDLVRTAPDAVRPVFQLAEEDGRAVWWWPRFAMLAQKLGTGG
jgi:hypothetical protein